VTRLTRFVLRHRAWVGVFWLVALLAGGATSSTTVSRLIVDFSLPGQPGYETSKQILDDYGNGTDFGATVVAVTAPQGQTIKADQAKVDGVFSTIEQKYPMYRVLSPANTANDPRLLTKDGRTAYGIVIDKRFKSFADKGNFVVMKPTLRQEAQATGLTIRTTGYVELDQGDSSDNSNGPSLLLETLLGGLGALLVLIFVFASFLALVPMVVAIVSILSTFLCVLALSYVMDVSFIVQFLIALVGLGVAVDYSLLVVNRWREERDRGRDNHDAVVVAMQTAGHAVVSSAGTVAISLLALVAIPVPFMRSMGIGGMLIPLVSTLVVLTLLPAILGSIGPRVDWPHLRHEKTASRSWSAWARLVSNRRWIAAGVGFVLLALLIVPVFGIKIGVASSQSLATAGPAVTTFAELRDGGVPAGVLTPLEILVRGDHTAAQAVADRVAKVDGIAAALAPDSPGWSKRGTSVLLVFPVNETVDLAQAKVVDRVHAAIDGMPQVIGVAGTGATVQDYSNAVFKRFPLVMLLIALVTFLLLVRAFRSLLLPLKAVILNVISVAATFGFVVVFWQHGHGSHAIFGISPTGAVTFWLPALIFAFLFGLSMDYEVFILSRMREEYDKTGSTRHAVVEGLGRTGRLVTCAALILFLAFTALASSPGTEVKVLATALGVGILLDATIVRALLVPALVSVLGKWNWWLPDWLAKPLRVAPSPLVDEQPPPIAADREPATID
jgi:RND superfamily putative drug exporter